MFLLLLLDLHEDGEGEGAGRPEELRMIGGLPVLELAGGECTDELEITVPLEISGLGVELTPEFEPEPEAKMSVWAPVLDVNGWSACTLKHLPSGNPSLPL